MVDVRSSTSPGGSPFDLDSQAGVMHLLASIRASGLSSAQKNELRDLAFLYMNGGQDASLRHQLEKKLATHDIPPLTRNVVAAATDRRALPFGSSRPTPTFTAPTNTPSTPSAANDAAHSANTPASHGSDQSPTGSDEGGVTPRPDVPPPSDPAAADAPSPPNKKRRRRQKKTAAEPDAPNTTAPQVTPDVTTTPATTEDPTPVAESASPAQPVASRATPVQSTPSQPAAETDTRATHLARVREIKAAVNERVGNPVNLIDIDNQVGREYMTALLEAMKTLNSGSQAEAAMTRLETALRAVNQVLDQESGTPDQTGQEPSASPVAVPSNDQTAASAEVTPPAATDSVSVDSVSGTEKTTAPAVPNPHAAAATIPKSPPPPTQSEVPQPESHTSATVASPPPVTEAPQIPSASPAATSAGASAQPAHSVPSARRSVPIADSDQANTAPATEQTVSIQSSQRGQAAARVTSTESPPSPASNIATTTSDETSTPATAERWGSESVATPAQAPVATPTTPSAQSSAAPPRIPSVADVETQLRTPNDLPDPADVETSSQVSDPLYTAEVDEGLSQLLEEWELFKKSGFFGTGPKGREHPLFKKLAGLQIPLVLAGRFEGATQQIRQNITDTMNGWRYQQGIVYQQGETLEHYLRRVVRHIIDLQNQS